MDSKERKLVVVLLSISFSMLISGCYFVPFVVRVWTYLANLGGEKDVFLASLLVIYFTMFALLGAALGLLINAYVFRAFQAGQDGIRRILSQRVAAKK